jgi:putative ABC transport system permease protein
MRISDDIGQAGGNLWKKKLRTFLTTSGVVIGVGALVCMFAFGQGIQRNITDQFKKLDLFNYITVFGPGSRRGPARITTRMTLTAEQPGSGPAEGG